MVKKVTTIEDLRSNLLEVFEQLSNDEIPLAKAGEMSNTAGKIINTAKVQLSYYDLRKEAPNIPFLESSAGTRENSK